MNDSFFTTCFPCYDGMDAMECVYCHQFTKELSNMNFDNRLASLRKAFLDLNLYTMECLDEDIIPAIDSEKELVEYEEIFKTGGVV